MQDAGILVHGEVERIGTRFPVRGSVPYEAVGLTRKVVHLRAEQRVVGSEPGKKHESRRICTSGGVHPVDNSTAIGMEAMFL